MKLIPLKIPDVIVIEPDVFEDERGFFFEAFNQREFNNAIGKEHFFVQDNHSKSKKGVLRGLHYQEPPYEQSKLIRVISGEIYDIALDIREKSETYGLYVYQYLSSKNKKQLWIPSGFAHGFLALTDDAEVIYKTTNFYSPDHERCIKYDDNNFNINWPGIESEQFCLSVKDR